MAEKIVAQTAVIASVFSTSYTVLPGGDITVPSGNNQISGSDAIAAGTSESFIANTKVQSASKIIVTPTAATRQTLSVVEKRSGEGFKVAVPEAVTDALPFDWIIINSYAVTGDSNIISTSIANTTPSTGVSGSNVDTIAPVITISGNNPATINVGATYSDLGAIVTDNVSFGITPYVSGEQIDTSVAGTHTVTYTARDEAGNWATSTRAVNVINQNATVNDTAVSGGTTDTTDTTNTTNTTNTAATSIVDIASTTGN